MPPTLRPSTGSPADTDFLAAVYASTRAEELAMTDWTDERKAAFCRMQFDAQTQHYHTHYPTAQYFIIERDGQPIGRLFVDHWPREIRIMDISLLPQHRGQGAGAHLLNNLIHESNTSGKLLSIHVEKFNPALRLYDRLGFKIAGEEHVYWRMERHPTSPRSQP